MKQAIMAKSPHHEPEKNVHLLCHSDNHPWVKSVAHHFIQQGYNVLLITLKDLPLHDNEIVSLLDLDGPFLRDIAVEKYNDLLKYLSHRQRTPWVTQASQIKCQDPFSGLILGLAQTVRLEGLAPNKKLE